MNERAAEPSTRPPKSVVADVRLAALARPVAESGLSLALYAHDASDAVGVAHALAMRLREVHGLDVEFFVPADGDGLIARLAQIVAGVPLSELGGEVPSSAPHRVLVAADASPLQVHAEQALAALVRDCPGTNTRIILPVEGRPDDRDRRVPFGPQLIRLSLDAQPEDADEGGADPEDADAENAGAEDERAEDGGSSATPVDAAPHSPSQAAPVGDSRRRTRMLLAAGGLVAVLAVLALVAYVRLPASTTPVAGRIAPGAQDPAPAAPAAAAREDDAVPAAAPAADSQAEAAARVESPGASEPAASGTVADAGSRTESPVAAVPAPAPEPARPPATTPEPARPPAAPAGSVPATPSEPVAALPAARPDLARVRRARDRAFFVQHAAVASEDEARAWLDARPALDRAGGVPILAADGRPMVAIVSGPFPDRASAEAWATTRTTPDERWLRGARSLKAALRAP